MDSLCLKMGIHGVAPAISVGGGVDVRASAAHVSAVGRSAADKQVVAPPPQRTGPFRFSFQNSFTSLLPGRGGGKDQRHNGLARDDAVLLDTGETRIPVVEENESAPVRMAGGQNGNWVLKILHARSICRDEERRKKSGGEEESEPDDKGIKDAVSNNGESDDDECDACRIDDVDVDADDKKELQFDRESFSGLLKRVSLVEAKVYAQMSYLGNLAYSVTKIKPGNLLKYHGLRFVTSSVEKRQLATKSDENGVLAETQESETRPEEEDAEGKEQKNTGYRISASAAYQIAASAASYLHSHTRSMIPFKSSKTENSPEVSENTYSNVDNVESAESKVASLMATTDSVTAVVAAREEVKQAVADDLKSTCSSPCDWFICDDDRSHTRFFVIQGSESLASWQANLLFEPIQFEGFDVLVHRGIYEAAKGIYEQWLPEVQSHLKSHRDRALFRFTGHSLGGSLSLLVNLMLLIRGEVPASSLLPVITFGSPSIMCGGDRLLQKLGLPKSHVQAITMHRDIVPRAFSCSYPNHVAELLKAVNGNFRNHPCLNNQKLLYAPMGKLLILQPDEKFSPQHHLLPSGSGLYFLKCPLSDIEGAEKQVRAAQTVFLNSPHPLEILSDRSAYGSEGTIQRDHDMNSYLKSVRTVIRQELSGMRKAKKEQRRKLWWPILAPLRGINVGGPMGTVTVGGQDRVNFSGIVSNGRESLRRFSRLVASQHMHLLVVLLFPAKLLLLGAYSMVR